MGDGLLLKAGSVDITPLMPIPLAGLFDRTDPYSTIADKLEANAVLLRDDKQKVIIVSTDLFFIGKTLRNGILGAIKDIVSDQELFISASHSHFTPATDDSKPLLGKVDSEYLSLVIARISGLIRELVTGKAERGSLFYSVGSNSSSNINRRRFAWAGFLTLKKEMEMMPNAKAFKDPSIRMIKVVDRNNNIMAVLWNYCCHPTGFNNLTSVSAEYPGFVRKKVRGELKSDIPVLFLQGFSGDVRPKVILKAPKKKTSPAYFKFLVSRLHNGPRFGIFSDSEWIEWAQTLSNSVIEVVRRKDDKQVEARLENKRVTIEPETLGLKIAGGPVSFHRIDVGDVRIIGISAETVAEYLPLLESAFPDSKIIPVSYLDHVLGYLPTNKMLSEGGYEVDGFQKYFSVKADFPPDLQERIIGAIRSL